MASPSDYRLRVTAGTSYDPATHVPVPINSPVPLRLHAAGAEVALNVRIRGANLEGRVSSAAPNEDTSAYFDAEPHHRNQDTYSIGVWFVPRAPAVSTNASSPGQGLSGHDLVWGNDFDAPIRHWLPPGFGPALRFATWCIDPGLAGDPYADRPFLYGPALSSFNRIFVGDSTADTATPSWQTPPLHPDRGLWFPEGGSAEGRAWRAALGCPGPNNDHDDHDDHNDHNDHDHDHDRGDNDSRRVEREFSARDAAARTKWALGAPAKDSWTWEYGRAYGLDFFNGYFDFSTLALRLPGANMLPTFSLLRFWDRKTSLRYVLRRRPRSGKPADSNEHDTDVFLVVVFALVPVADGEDAEVPVTKEEDANDRASVSIDDVD